MLSSLILSFAMSATPTPVINNEVFIIEEVGGRRNSVRIDMNKVDVIEVGARRNSVRIDMNKVDVIEVGGRRNSVRIDTSSNEISI
jgi:hypothetical protein